MKLNTKNTVRCSRCGSKEVFFERRYSGEFLCLKCLRRSLIRRMERAVSKYNLLERDDSIIYIHTDFPYNEVLHDMFLEMESNFPVKIKEFSCKEITKRSIKFRWKWLSDVARFSMERDEKVVVPILLDDVIALFLRFIFSGSPEVLFLRGRLFLATKAISKVVSPFIELPIDEVLSLTHTIGNLTPEQLQEIFHLDDPYLKMVWEFEQENPGMRFSFLRSIQRTDLLESIGIIF